MAGMPCWMCAASVGNWVGVGECLKTVELVMAVDQCLRPIRTMIGGEGGSCGPDSSGSGERGRGGYAFWVMKASIIFRLLAFSVLAASAAQVSLHESKAEGSGSSGHDGVGTYVVEKRHFRTICPPVFESTREVAQRYLDGGLIHVIQPDELALVFDLPVLKVDDLEPLDDEDDLEVCERLDEQFAHLFHEAGKVPGDSGLESEHFYEITYYRAESQGMYIAILSGRPIVWRHRPTKTQGYIKPPGPGTTVRFFDDNVQLIDRQDVRERLERLG